jgi:hypothetical protein
VEVPGEHLLVHLILSCLPFDPPAFISGLPTTATSTASFSLICVVHRLFLILTIFIIVFVVIISISVILARLIIAPILIIRSVVIASAEIFYTTDPVVVIRINIKP